jgi:hypothetical protein
MDWYIGDSISDEIRKQAIETKLILGSLEDPAKEIKKIDFAEIKQIQNLLIL